MDVASASVPEVIVEIDCVGSAEDDHIYTALGIRKKWLGRKCTLRQDRQLRKMNVRFNPHETVVE